MEKYCVKRARPEDWGFNKQGDYYRLETVMEHIMNNMAKEGWTVKSTCYGKDSVTDEVMITFVKQV